jgi:hypothetical protein
MRPTHLAFLIAVILLIVSAARARDKPDDYLTKDGQLKDRLEVLELQGGFAGFTGTYYVIEADGSWSTGAVLPGNKRGEAKAKGKLTAEQLASLAKDLARHELASLKNHGEPVVNPRVVEIRFGKSTAVLQPERGKAAPEEDKAVRARYAGIAEAVRGLAKEPKKE